MHSCSHSNDVSTEGKKGEEMQSFLSAKSFKWQQKVHKIHKFPKLVMLPWSIYVHVIHIHLCGFFFYKSSRMRSESNELLVAVAAIVWGTPRLWRRVGLGEFCFSLLGGSAFKSSRAPYAAMENSGSPVVSKSKTQDWKYTSSTCRVSLHLAVARSTV